MSESKFVSEYIKWAKRDIFPMKQKQTQTQRFMRQQGVNLRLLPITKNGLPYRVRAALTNHAVSLYSAARKTVLHSKAGNPMPCGASG